MPRHVWITIALLGSLALVPLACVGRARVKRSASPRLHLIQDMDNQGKFTAQQANPMFADGRAMRRPVQGTVARGELGRGDMYELGLVNGEYAADFPVELTMDLLERGQERYGIYCSPCHGFSGYGDGMVTRRADRLQQGTWVPPASMHDQLALSRPPGHLFNTITNGIRNMPAYGSQIPVDDRWAIVGYIRALQRSQSAQLGDVPPEQRNRLGDPSAARAGAGG